MWLADRDFSTPGEGGITCHQVTAWDAAKAAYKAAQLMSKVIRFTGV